MTITNARSKNFDFGAFAVPKKLVQNFEIQTVKIPVYKGTIKTKTHNKKQNLLTQIKETLFGSKNEETFRFSNLYNWEIQELKVLKVKLTGATVNFRTSIDSNDLRKTMYILKNTSKKDLPKVIQEEMDNFLSFSKKLDAFELIEKNLTDIEDELNVHFQENGISVTTK